MSSNSYYLDTFEETLNTLNEAQRNSALSDATNLQILAGPGSGKTRVLTVRVAYLVLKKNIKPKDIIVVTFTNKAANEMIERLNVLIGPRQTKQLLIGTFHSICSRLLRRFGSLISIDSTFTILDTEQAKDIVQSVLTDKSLQLDEKVKKLPKGEAYGIISKAKNKGLTPSKYSLQAYNDFLKGMALVYTEYEEKLRVANVMDFDNLLLFACKLLRSDKTVLANIEAILVDEYQDTNGVQYDLIKLMTQQTTEKNITIVGDPDQSIFGWRNAEPKNFLKMQEDFETSALNMEQNYRSSGTVLKSALHVISQDKQRIDKTLYTNNPEGIPISLISTANEDSQAEFIAKEIKRVMKYSKGLITYRDIAVLLRMNFISRQFETVFRRHKIPFTIVGGDRFFDRIEVKDILSYLRLAYNPRDEYSFRRIINVPKRGIGEVTLVKIIEHRNQKGLTMLETLEAISYQKAVPSLSSVIRSGIKHLYDVIDEIIKRMKTQEDISEILLFVLNAINYKSYLEDHYRNDFESRWNNVSELISLATKFTTSLAYEEEDIDSSQFVFSQETNYNIQKSSNNKYKKENITVLDESDIISSDLDDEDEKISVIDFDEIENSQKYESEGTGFDEQYKEVSDVLEKALNEDFNEDDEPIYGLQKTLMEQFLEYCSLCSNEKEIEEAENGKVTIATMHASKGLEWPCVFIPTCNDGIIPANRSESLDEEGRLLYVAMTRSQFLLYCISPDNRDIFGNRQRQTRTLFLRSMDKKLYTDSVSQWNNDVRKILASILKRDPPPDDDKLCTTNKGFSSAGVYSNNNHNENMDIRFGASGSRVDLDVMGGFSSALNMMAPLKKKGNSIESGFSKTKKFKK